MFIATNKVNVVYCIQCEGDTNANENLRETPRIQKKYIRQEKSEPINKFMCEGGTYHKHISGMLYHKFLVVMLGSTVLAKSVDKVVLSNDYNTNLTLINYPSVHSITNKYNKNAGITQTQNIRDIGANIVFVFLFQP